MPSKPSDTLRGLHHTWDPDTFSTLSLSAVLQSKDPVKALSEDPPVVHIQLFKKDETPEQHEFIVNDLKDKGKELRYALERTVVLPPANAKAVVDDRTIERFLRHPISQKILDTILETVGAIPSSVLVGGAAVAVGAAVTALGLVTIPVAAVSAVASASVSFRSAPSASLRSMEEGTSSSYLPRSTTIPIYSLREKASLTIVDVLQALSDSQSVHIIAEAFNIQKVPLDTPADDRFLGEDRFNYDEYKTASKLLGYEPKRLTRVHIVILAQVIHTAHPLYSLFRRQCYWFACTFYYAAILIDCRLQKINAPIDVDAEGSDDMFVPFHLIQSKLAGCWHGIRIHGVQLVLLNHIVMKFDEQLAKLTAEVEEKRRESDELMQLREKYQARDQAANTSGLARLTRRNV